MVTLSCYDRRGTPPEIPGVGVPLGGQGRISLVPVPVPRNAASTVSGETLGGVTKTAATVEAVQATASDGISHGRTARTSDLRNRKPRVEEANTQRFGGGV